MVRMHDTWSRVRNGVVKLCVPLCVYLTYTTAAVTELALASMGTARPDTYSVAPPPPGMATRITNTGQSVIA